MKSNHMGCVYIDVFYMMYTRTQKTLHGNTTRKDLERRKKDFATFIRICNKVFSSFKSSYFKKVINHSAVSLYFGTY